MLHLDNIKKRYQTGGFDVEALKGVSLDFRDSEFVAVLGPSGCGKTTLLNLIGGLDRYTSGDLVINGVSTKRYKDVDWDIYRNNSIGFVFQNYNLIPHQSVLANVELAMTLAGVSKSERRRRAKEALEQVGLGDQLHKKPTQMSGGQMQRVAIARALVNNPDILLADEPTGALDSETSTQVMDILRDVAKDRLVIIVTHNADIAAAYANRIIRILDGRIIDDTNPYEGEPVPPPARKKRKKVSMSFLTALALSLNNLMTKKTRTFLTAFAGSIGIIGIALILSLSDGMQGYIKDLETNTMSTYPLQIYSQSMDMSGLLSLMMSSGGGLSISVGDTDMTGVGGETAEEEAPDRIYVRSIARNMLSAVADQVTVNDLKSFMDYIENGDGNRLYGLTNSIKYGYDIELQVYNTNAAGGTLRVNPSEAFDNLGMGTSSTNANYGMSMGSMGTDQWSEMLGNEELLRGQFELVAGAWPTSYDEVVFVLGENGRISDVALYSLGVLDPEDLEDMLAQAMMGEKTGDTGRVSLSYDDVMGLTFKLVLNTDYYEKDNGVWRDMRDDEAFMEAVLENALELRVSGIVKPAEDAAAASIRGAIGYTAALTEYVIGAVNASEIAREQIANRDINVFTGMPFDMGSLAENLTMDDVRAMLEFMTDEQRAQVDVMLRIMPEEQVLAMFSEQLAQSSPRDTYESNRTRLGMADAQNPSVISLYPKDFATKHQITSIINEYNQAAEAAGRDDLVIKYTDMVELMTSSISSIIDIVTYVLIAFVAISLVVSSIMIAIITYISVLERTKEIGVLRSIGASKRDVSRVFNAETVIEGFVAGALGVGVTILLNFPVNAVIKSLSGVSGLSALPLYGVIGLIVLSVLLTVVAGFVPSKIAAKKDPVVALRSE